MARHITVIDTETGKTELDIVAVAGMYTFTAGGTDHGGTEHGEVYSSIFSLSGNKLDIIQIYHEAKEQIKDFETKYGELAALEKILYKLGEVTREVISEETETEGNIEH